MGGIILPDVTPTCFETGRKLEKKYSTISLVLKFNEKTAFSVLEARLSDEVMNPVRSGSTDVLWRPSRTA